MAPFLLQCKEDDERQDDLSAKEPCPFWETMASFADGTIIVQIEWWVIILLWFFSKLFGFPTMAGYTEICVYSQFSGVSNY